MTRPLPEGSEDWWPVDLRYHYALWANIAGADIAETYDTIVWVRAASGTGSKYVVRGSGVPDLVVTIPPTGAPTVTTLVGSPPTPELYFPFPWFGRSPAPPPPW